MSTPAAGPWTKYAQQQPTDGPWSKYAQPAATPTPKTTQLEKAAQPTVTGAYNPGAEKYGPAVRALDAAGGAVLSTPGAIGSAVMHPIDTAKGIGQSIGAWFDPKTRPTWEGIKSVLPEAIGTGLGNAAVGEATPQLAKIGANATEGARTSIGGAIRNGGSDLKPGIRSTAQTVGAVTGGAPGLLHGNIEGSLLGGYAGAKAGPALLERAFPEPPRNVGAPLPSYEDYATNRGTELNKMRAMDDAAQRRQAKIAPPTVDTPGGFGGPLPSTDEFYGHRGSELNAMRKQQPEAFTPKPIEQPSFPGAPLPSTDEFYQNRGTELNRIRSMNESLNSKQAAAEPATPRIALPSDAGPRFTGNEGSPARWTNERVKQLAGQGNREAIQQSVRRGFELPPNARYVAGDPDFSAGTYNPRDVTRFSPEGTPIRQGGKGIISAPGDSTRSSIPFNNPGASGQHVTMNPIGQTGARPLVSPANQFESSFGPEHQEVGDLAEWETGNREGVRPKRIIVP